MKKGRLLLTMLALSLGSLLGGSGAMAQNGWEAVYSKTQTTSDSWVAISQGSTNGKVLGTAGATTYYYITESLNFTNDRTDNGGDGNSGLKIQGTVYLYIPYGLHIFCRGANADGRTGAGAGIELSEGNTLYIIGGGEGAYVEAIGGNAENGRNGADGGNADYSYDSWIRTGAGGAGGNGGGGAGAGIGTRGGNGGTGGAGGNSQEPGYVSYTNGTNGSNGSGGETAGKMGNLYVDQTLGLKVNATAGSAGTSNGSGGARGTSAIEDSESKNYSMAGGGGGGGGGFGGAACNIGTGGPGGGGGGGGAGGNQERCRSGYLIVYAPGGAGGKGADGSTASKGSDADITGDVSNGKIITNYNGWKTTDEDKSADGKSGSGGDGAGCGNAASNGTMNADKLEYTITYNFVTPAIKTESVKYSPSSGTTVILPKNKDGYQWVMLVYGKDCRATGKASPFTDPDDKTFYGGDSDEEADRTILLKDVYGDLTFQEIAATCKLNNMGDNSQLLTEFFFNEVVESQKYPITVRLKDRTLYKDNSWNTICLPFDMTPAQISASPLAGAEIWKMDDVNTGYYPNGFKLAEANMNTTIPTLILYFESAKPNVNGLQKGKPYLVKWASGKDLVDDTAGKVHQLDFNNVTITEKVAGSWYANGVTFQGTFSQSPDLEANDRTKLVLGADNKLYYPSEVINVGSCRGYFIVPREAAKTRAILMGFDGENGEATSIQTLNIDPENQGDARIFNLRGQRLNAPQKGINIINGKKYIK